MGSISTINVSTAANGAVQSAVQSMIVPQRGKLVGIGLGLSADLKTDAGYFHVECSFGSTGFASGTPLWSVLAKWSMQMGFVTSGLALAAINDFRPLPGIPVFVGQYIYVHQNGTSGITPALLAVSLAFDFDQMVLMS